MEIERRFYQVELRMDGEGDQRRLIGHGAVFNVLSENLGGFRELIMPGAFDDVLQDDVRALWNHDPNWVLGRTKNDTLSLSVDETGLRYEIIPPDTEVIRGFLANVNRGDVDQSSFAYQVGEVSWQEPDEENPLPIRKIHKYKRLLDVSPVTFPAYPATSAEARAMASKLAAQAGGPSADVEQIVRRHSIRRRRLDLLELS